MPNRAGWKYHSVVVAFNVSSSFDKVILAQVSCAVNLKSTVFFNFCTFKQHLGEKYVYFLQFALSASKGVYFLSTLEKINELLKQQHKKQKDLTDYLGLTKNTFTNWKLGTSESYKKHINKIAEFFNVSTDYLLGVENKNNPAADSDEALAFALFGGDTQDITPEMLEDVRNYAQFVRERRKKENQWRLPPFIILPNAII